MSDKLIRTFSLSGDDIRSYRDKYWHRGITPFAYALKVLEGEAEASDIKRLKERIKESKEG